MVNGVEERHSEGSYYIEWREGARRVPLSVGTNAADAMAKRLRKEAELNAVAHGATIAPDPATTGRSLATAIAQYLEDVKTKQAVNRPNNFGRHNKHGCYFTALAYFLESCHKQTLGEIKRRDMLKFAAFLQVRKRPRPA